MEIFVFDLEYTCDLEVKNTCIIKGIVKKATQ